MTVTQKFLTSSFLIAVTALAYGCASSRYTTGTPIRDADVQSVIKGKTTMNEIIGTFGEPTRMMPMGDETIYIYEYKVTLSESTNILVPEIHTNDYVDKLSITFDKNKVVSTYHISRGVPNTKG